jgi:hypothetical protein
MQILAAARSRCPLWHAVGRDCEENGSTGQA